MRFTKNRRQTLGRETSTVPSRPRGFYVRVLLFILTCFCGTNFDKTKYTKNKREPTGRGLSPPRPAGPCIVLGVPRGCSCDFSVVVAWVIWLVMRPHFVKKERSTKSRRLGSGWDLESPGQRLSDHS